ncbi:signal peptidase II [Clostridium luticellarii]|jgi:signal peptidase II|uniref:Lipoprotein signal peptidase n=1 Tax=Clostridium luticellarii TaxID=1691940 RepID=A0A2T0BRW8_9CLOT|nr:signal peptidase II [Clostridium luticellarii]MCI1943722.1 signal peptidase II [Clostridium luticellarii]MCI1966983.1 signal peptidase II [Clostridium luticellarii]MCI1994350.1 signal peptidase II [Clostridium luticellarii]MCI2038697.1 signal peptidase II [Clostridium luticellarii]PRR86572.1 Lipoprotein signal peptidase [Clostridium luticellarii]
MEISIILVGILIDRISKIWAAQNLAQVSQVIIIKDVFSFFYLENRGAAFGILQNKVYFLTFITVPVVAGMIYYMLRYRPKSVLVRVSLSLIVGGALGNLIDRLFYKYVVDFILVHFKDIYYFPVFNVADVLVVVGTILLIFYLLKEEKYGC